MHHSSAMKKAICCSVIEACIVTFLVASGFNFTIGHFLHLNRRVEREKVNSPLHHMIQNKMEKVWLACVQLILLNLSYKRILHHRSALKTKQFVVEHLEPLENTPLISS